MPPAQIALRGAQAFFRKLGVFFRGCGGGGRRGSDKIDGSLICILRCLYRLGKLIIRANVWVHQSSFKGLVEFA